MIPSLDVDAPVQETSWHIETIDGQPVAVWDTLTDAVGHLTGSALPGQAGNCVLAGHSRSDEGGVFYGLDDLAEGDLVLVQDDAGVQHRYVVRDQETFPELGEDLVTRQAQAQSVTAQNSDGQGQEAVLTLITCWPDWAYTHRLVIVANLAD